MPTQTIPQLLSVQVRPSDTSALLLCAASFLLLLYSPLRIHLLFEQDVKVTHRLERTVKLTVSLLLVALNAAILAQLPSQATLSLALVVNLLSLAASVVILPLIYLEDQRNLRPSTVLVLYFFASLLQDFWELWNLLPVLNRTQIYAIERVLLVCTKSVLIVLESFNKKKYFSPKYKNLSPETSSGFVNRTLFWWLNPLFIAGTKRRISSDDLYQLDQELGSELLGRRLSEVWNKRAHTRRFSFVGSVIECFKWEIGRIVLPRLVYVAFLFGQPALITATLQLLYRPDDSETKRRACELVAATALVYSGIAFTSSHSNHALFRFITMFRGAVVFLIYQESLSIKGHEIDTAGAISLTSNDVDTIAFCLEEVNECWSALVQLLIGVPLLARQLGWVAVMPIFVVVSSIGSSIIAKSIGNRQAEWAAASQSRITKTKTVLEQVKGIKMMGLDEKVQDILQEERIQETRKMARFAWVMVWVNVVANLPFAFAPSATFAVFAVQAHLRGSDSLDTVKAFASLALIRLVAYPASRLLSGVPRIFASFACFDRIQEYLLSSEPKAFYKTSNDADGYDNSSDENDSLLSEANGIGCIGCTMENRPDLAVLANGAEVRLPTGTTIFKGLNLSIPHGSTTCITGSVGTGKTTLLRALLKEIAVSSGTVHLSRDFGCIGYCAQTPWVPNGTIREVISGSSIDGKRKFDEEWYRTVVEVCALSQDIQSFALGDGTVVGSRGTALSGGQRQRIALARAVYQRPKLFLLDHVFRSLDGKTARTITARLLGSNGLLKKLKSTIIMVTYDNIRLKQADNVVVLPFKPGGSIQQGIYGELVSAGVLTEESVRSEVDYESQVGDELVKRAIEREALKGPDETEVSDLDRKTGNVAVYNYYLTAIGAVQFSIFLFFAMLSAFSGNFSGIWLKWWSDIQGRKMGLYISGYFLLSLAYALSIGGYAWVVAVIIAPSTGRILHKRLLRIVFSAPMSFFTNIETGTILNHFSQDMSIIQSQLATGLLVTVTNVLAAMAEAGLIASGSYYMVITLPLTFTVFYYLQYVYLRTSRQLRILELESRSPVYSHFLETLEGLETIRAFRCQSKMVIECEWRLENSQKPYYLMFCIERWLALVQDLIVGGLATAVISLALFLRYSTNPGWLGVSLNAVLSFNQSIAQFIAGWTALETSLGAIARLRQLEIDVKPEDQGPSESSNLPPEWPSRGHIKIRNLSASYSTNAPALKDVNVTVAAGEHVAVCGRTGSGKSTLLATILRLLPEDKGEIDIDSYRTSDVNLWTLRRRLVSIPQDFVHLPGSIRLNIDPFDQCTTLDIEGVLLRVGLSHKLESLNELDSNFDITKFSSGEQQLLSLARAILQRSAQKTAVVLTDEATSSLDEDAEASIYRLLAEEFKNSTVIGIAHRPAWIRMADSVVTLDHGGVVEEGKPKDLEDHLGVS